MKPIVPDQGPPGSSFHEFALGQEEYQVLPLYIEDDGTVMTEWELTPEEVATITKGGRIRLWVKTFNTPLQPVSLEVVGATT